MMVGGLCPKSFAKSPDHLIHCDPLRPKTYVIKNQSKWGKINLFEEDFAIIIVLPNGNKRRLLPFALVSKQMGTNRNVVIWY